MFADDGPDVGGRGYKGDSSDKKHDNDDEVADWREGVFTQEAQTVRAAFDLARLTTC